MVLKPLEFADCLTDSPWFRADLTQHEQALERAYKTIKLLENQSKELLAAELKLQTAHRNFAKTLQELRLETIGSTQTDDERMIVGSLKEYSKLILQVEDQRSQILEDTEANFIKPFRRFRIDCIGNALQHERKKYEKAHGKFYQSLEKNLHLSTSRRSDFSEADADLNVERQQFYKASLDYVCVLQSVQERMKFEFVENLSSFLYSCLTFYHVGHVIHEDFKPYLDRVKERVQKAKDNYIATERETEDLKNKMQRMQYFSNGEELIGGKIPVKQGYLYLLEKKNMVTSWTKYYCVYQKETRMFSMVPMSQMAIKDIKATFFQSVSFKMKSCCIRAPDTIDKRFCFDVVSDNDDLLTLQALSDRDRTCWLNVLGQQKSLHSSTTLQAKRLQTTLRNGGFQFVTACLNRIEEKFMDEQGLYRNCGVSSKVQRLLETCMENGFQEPIDFDDESEWDSKTMTSVVKAFLRGLPEPLMTFHLHSCFLNAAKMNCASERVDLIHFYVHQLPAENLSMLRKLVEHLRKVSQLCSVNLMTASNLAVCFGPCVMRNEEESVAAIMDMKFCNLTIEIIIEHFQQIFTTEPRRLPYPPPVKPGHTCQPQKLFGFSNSTPQLWVNSDNHSTLASGSDESTRKIEASHIVQTSSDLLDQEIPEDYLRKMRCVSVVDDPDANPVVKPYSAETLQRRWAQRAGFKPSSRASSPPSSAPPYVRSTNAAGGANFSCRRIRTLFQCDADCDCQLAFSPGQILTNVRPSSEPGWLIGTLNGRTGLVPDGYVESLP